MTPFDLADFSALSDGEQVSIVSSSSLVSDSRLDAECYKKIYIDNENTLLSKPYIHLGEETDKFVKGAFDINADRYIDSGVPFIRISDLKEMLIDNNNLAYISEEENEKYINSCLLKGDIVISKTAYPAASLVTTEIANTSQDIIAVKLKSNSSISGKILVLFLNSRYGYLQMLRWFTGNIQMHLNLRDSKNIIIQDFSTDFQNTLESVFDLGAALLDLSEIKYKQAESILLSEIGLTNRKPKHQLTFIKNHSDTRQAGRVDAEYYQPKYEEIIKAIQAYPGGWNILESLIKINDKSFSKKNNQEYKYIELAHVGSNGEVTGCMIDEGLNLPSRAKRKVKTGDVIISSIEGSLSSIALIENEYDQALCSTGFYVIRSDSINSETLLILLKSLVGQLQLKKGCKGTILTAINKEELKKIVLPKISKSKQLEIQQKVTESFNLRKQSKHLLECAKRAVEIAIEQDEETALRWLEQETQS